ncbi:MAG: hemin ABC transporter substrate-binding protein [Gemmatimonadales bacterium]|nr:MAG: hemin ABC transporter substrate-binding protein [Gemmatimonadales bacterium]
MRRPSPTTLPMALILGFTAAGAMNPAPVSAQTPSSSERVISLGGSVTEVLFALGAGSMVIARDGSSLYPAEVESLPNVGYRNGISAEGILALRPTLILTTRDYAPPVVLQQLRGAGVSVVEVSPDASIEGARERISEVAAAVGRTSEGEVLLARLDEDLSHLRRDVEAHPLPDHGTLILYLRGTQSTFVCGPDSAPGVMLALAGARNAAPDLRGCAPMTAESVARSRADILLVYTLGLDSVGGVEGLLTLPGIAQTPAGRTGRVVVMDDLYLGSFGPRSGRAARDLRSALAEGTGVSWVEGP